MTTNEEIRQRVLEAASPSVPQPPVSDRWWTFITTGMGACIVFLTVAIALTCVFRFKLAPKPVSNSDSDLRQKITQIETKMGDHEVRLLDHAHKLWLVAIVGNENAGIQLKANPDSNIVYFDEKWKLNRMPNTMELSDADRELLQKDIK